MKKKLFFIIFSFFLLKISVLPAFSEESTLTCNYPWPAIPPATHTISKETSNVKVNLGFSSTFGGVGVKFELINKENNSSIDILEARSAAGAGMQYTGMVYPDSGDGGLINQASGNGLGSQWGYSNDLQVSEQSGITTLFSNNWAPNYSDTWGGRGTSPCVNTAVSFDEGRPTVTAKLENVSDGSVIHVTSSYTLKSLVDQYWKIYVPASGFYLNRAIARQNNLRVYLFGKDGWQEGPIYPYDDFSITHGERIDNPGWRLLYHIQTSLKHVLFIWNINGKDIGILVPDIPFGATLRLGDKGYCDDKNNDSCGAVDFGTNDGIPINVSFPKGQERTYSYDYIIGTPDQLAKYGGFLLPFRELEKVKSFGPIGRYPAQYSPWVMHEPGWQSYLMYYCKGSPDPNWRDRVWRNESWTDGKTGWDEEGGQIVIEGSAGADDELSCSPGVVIDNNGIWHMYYITAESKPDVPLYIYHATASAPGLSWTKQGKVGFEGGGQPLFGTNVFMETPSPFVKNGQIILYFIGDQGTLYRAESNDGYNFTRPIKTNSPLWAAHGRVFYRHGLYFYIFATKNFTCCDPPTEIYLSISRDGINFPKGKLLAKTDGVSWDGLYMWSPTLFFETDEIMRVYYAGNLEKIYFWGDNSSIGLRSYSLSEAGILSILYDLNQDGQVNSQDLVVLLQNWGSSPANPQADLNSDGLVNGLDFEKLRKLISGT